ncbi:VanZ family protein [Arthrobacter sp. CP30]
MVCILWLGVLGLVVLSPLPVDRDGGTALRAALADLHRAGWPSWLGYRFVESTSNVILFVPFGMFFFILAPRGLRRFGPVTGLALSVGIELAQLIALPQRVASLSDIAANSLGVVIGSGVAWTATRVRDGVAADRTGAPPAATDGT